MSLSINAAEYDARQQEIDRCLSAEIVMSMLTEYAEKIIPTLLRNEKKRHVTIIFASTASLLRRINSSGDGKNDQAIGIEFRSIEEERARQPRSNVLKQCDSETQFCVTIATYLPISLLLGTGNDSTLTHTTTWLRLPFAVKK